MQEKKLTGYPSIDKPWLKYYSEEALAMKTPECTVYKNIYDNNKNYPKDIAIRYFNKDISYGVLFEQIEICAKSLKQIGIYGTGNNISVGLAYIKVTRYVCSQCGFVEEWIDSKEALLKVKKKYN